MRRSLPRTSLFAALLLVGALTPMSAARAEGEPDFPTPAPPAVIVPPDCVTSPLTQGDCAGSVLVTLVIECPA
jgi:hypothetical protein